MMTNSKKNRTFPIITVILVLLFGVSTLAIGWYYTKQYYIYELLGWENRFEILQTDMENSQAKADSIVGIYIDSLLANNYILEDIISENEELKSEYYEAKKNYNNLKYNATSAANEYIKSWTRLIKEHPPVNH